MLPNIKKTIGECEACGAAEVVIILTHHNMSLCESCMALEKEAIERSKKATQLMDTSRKIDAEIEIKSDIFNTAAISFVELQAAIENNREIPTEKKGITLIEEAAARVDKLRAVIFAEDAALLAKRNELLAWQVNLQQMTSKLHEKEREKYKQYDINYKPQTPKTVKPKAVTVKAPKFDKVAVYNAATKYNLKAAQVQSIVVAQNKTPEDAAKYLAGILGLL